MSALIKLFRLLYPFLHEFGIKEVNIKAFIIQNKTISYLMLICIMLFVMFLFALEQAHLRMVHTTVLMQENSELQIEVNTSNDKIEQIEMMYADDAFNTPINNINSSIESSLNELMGKGNEE